MLTHHVHAGRMMSGCLCRIGLAEVQGHRIMVVSPEMALLDLLSREPDHIANLLLLWEACGSYQTELTSTRTCFDVEPLTSAARLGSLSRRIRDRAPGRKRMLRALKRLSDCSGLPRETALALLLGMPSRHGGYGLGIPIMNREVPASRQAFALTGRRSFRLGLSWPGTMLDVEYQSHLSHEGERMRVSDSRREKALVSMAWQVAGVTDVELSSLVMTNEIADIVRRAIWKGHRDFPEGHHRLKLQLRGKPGIPSP